MNTTQARGRDYLKESSTKVVHTRFLMILGIQLYEHENNLSEEQEQINMENITVVTNCSDKLLDSLPFLSQQTSVM